MTFQSLVTLFFKIVNSAACVGIYYGMLTSFSIRPSFFLLLVEEPEKRRAVINGLLLGQLVKFLSIYNAPLHRLLSMPHTVVACFIPYLLIYCYYYLFHEDFYLSESPTFSFFLHSFIFHLCSPIFSPNAVLARVGHIYLFQSKNKLDFLMGNFFGWAIGQVWFILVLERLFSWVYKFSWLYKYTLSHDQPQLVSKLKNSITKYLGEEFPAFLDQRVSEFLTYRNKYSNKIYQYLAKHFGRDFTELVKDYKWFVSEVKYFVLADIFITPGRLMTILFYIIILDLVVLRQPALLRKNFLSNHLPITPVQRPYLKTQIERSYDLMGVVHKMKRIKNDLQNDLQLNDFKNDLPFKESRATLLKDSEVDRDVDLNEVEVELKDSEVDQDVDLNEVEVELKDSEVDRDVDLNEVEVELKDSEVDGDVDLEVDGDVDLNEVEVELKDSEVDGDVDLEVDGDVDLEVDGDVDLNEVEVELKDSEVDGDVDLEVDEDVDGDVDLEVDEDVDGDVDLEVDEDVDLNEVEVEPRLDQPILVDNKIENFVMNFFIPKGSVRPFRYIRNQFFTAAVQERASQYFFDTCRSDGKERIAFTYLPLLSSFKAMMKRVGISSSTVERPSFDELDQTWINQNNEKKKT